MKSVCVALASSFAIVSVCSQMSWAQDMRARVLIGVGTVAAGVILGTQKAWTEEKQKKEAASKSAAEMKRIIDDNRRKDEQARKDAAARLSSALGTRINTQVYRPSPGSPGLAKALSNGKLYRLGPGWGTSAAHCISYISSACSPCDRNPSTNTCVVRLNERILNIAGAKVQ